MKIGEIVHTGDRKVVIEPRPEPPDKEPAPPVKEPVKKEPIPA